jgi:hypothetical protein
MLPASGQHSIFDTLRSSGFTNMRVPWPFRGSLILGFPGQFGFRIQISLPPDGFFPSGAVPSPGLGSHMNDRKPAKQQLRLNELHHTIPSNPRYLFAAADNDICTDVRSRRDTARALSCIASRKYKAITFTEWKVRIFARRWVRIVPSFFSPLARHSLFTTLTLTSTTFTLREDDN